MARFISILSGSNPNLPYHNVRSISNGISLRNGLIASRSALSADIYAELSSINQDGGRGVFFPADLININRNAGFISGSAYTSSRAGIVTPVNYSTRPTASVLSNDPLSVPTDPLNRASASITLYDTARTATRTVLDSITDGGPFGRLGKTPSRTLHSVYHDPALGYFAWDDFTPGSASLEGISADGPPITTDGITTNQNVIFVEYARDFVTMSLNFNSEFQTDTFGAITTSLSLRNIDNLVVRVSNTSSIIGGEGTPVSNRILYLSASAFVGNSLNQDRLEAQYAVRFSDINIPTNQSDEVMSSYANLTQDGMGPVRVQTLFKFNDGIVSASFDPVAWCSTQTAAPTLYGNGSTAALNTRLYTDTAGTKYSPVEGSYYVSFGEVTSNTPVYQYDIDGKLIGSPGTANCQRTGQCIPQGNSCEIANDQCCAGYFCLGDLTGVCFEIFPT